MIEPAIQVKGIGKRYKIGLREETGHNFREMLVNTVTAPIRRLRALREHSHTGEDLFWALQEVSFDVMPGEVVGVIGRNGAGKSTLLKILSRITEPTTGRATINGRVASLLEVGTGFHPDLTGRENIFLNGAILGMKKVEIKEKFDEIIAFAEIDKFLDTPVKRYSSGMRVRLGFAIAAHLDPEILIVDEILAVGDFAFQKKCLGKMEDVAHGGRTVLFVSHNMGAVQDLCSRAILLQHGRVIDDGHAGTVISEYFATSAETHLGTYCAPRNPGKLFQILEVSVCDEKGKAAQCFDIAAPVHVNIKYAMDVALEGSVINLDLARQGVVLAKTYDTDQYPHLLDRRPAGVHTCSITIPPMFLKPGQYSAGVSLGIARQRVLDHVENAVTFDVVSHSVSDSYKAFSADRPGLVIFPGHWHITQ